MNKKIMLLIFGLILLSSFASASLYNVSINPTATSCSVPIGSYSRGQGIQAYDSTYKYVKGVYVWVQETVNSPTGLDLYLSPDSSGAPDMTNALGNITLDDADVVDASYNYFGFSAGSYPLLTVSTQYHISLDSLGGTDSYKSCYESGSYTQGHDDYVPYANRYTPASWTETSNLDYKFIIEFSSDDGSVVLNVSSPIFVSPTPATTSRNNTQVTINFTCSDAENHYLWFNSSPTPTTLVLDNSSSGEYTTNVGSSTTTYYYIAGCYNNTIGFSSNTTVRSWIYDEVNPVITLNIGNEFNSTGNVLNPYDDVVKLNISASDDEDLYGFQINITDKNGVSKFNYTNIGLSGLTYNYTNSLNVASWDEGVYNAEIWVSDSHTANTIKEYSVDNKKMSEISFKTTNKNNIKISTSDTSTFTSTKYTDRYKFSVDFGEKPTKFGVVSKKDRLFHITTDLYPLDYISDSKFQAHFVSWDGHGGNWIDFEGAGSHAVITKINDYHYTIFLRNVSSIVTFNSIGGLNVISKNYSFYRGKYSFNNASNIVNQPIIMTLNVTTVINSSPHTISHGDVSGRDLTNAFDEDMSTYVADEAYNSYVNYSLKDTVSYKLGVGILDASTHNFISLDNYSMNGCVDGSIDDTLQIKVNSDILSLINVYCYNNGLWNIIHDTSTHSEVISRLDLFSVDDLNASFIYNGVAKNVSASYYDTSTVFKSSFVSPSVSGTYDFNWTINMNTFGVVDTLNSSQVINDFGFEVCTDSNYSVNFSYYSEDVPSFPLSASLEVSFISWVQGNPSFTINYSNNFSSNTFQEICLKPYDKTLQADIYAKYTTPTGFTHRYIVYNGTYNTTVNNINLYNFNYTSGISDLKIVARDIDTYNAYSNVVGTLQRLYVSEGVWRNVQMDESGDFGNIFFNIIEENTDYRIIYKDINNNVLKTTSTLKFICVSDVCSVTQLLSPYSSSNGDVDAVASCNLDENTKIMSCTWSTDDGSNQEVTFLLYQVRPTGNLVVCNSTVNGASGTFTCNTTGYTGTAYIVLDIEGNSLAWSEFIEFVETKLNDLINANDGAIIVVGLVITMAGAVAVSPIAVIIMGIVSLIVAMFLGLFSGLTIGVITVVVVIGIIIAVRIKK